MPSSREDEHAAAGHSAPHDRNSDLGPRIRRAAGEGSSTGTGYPIRARRDPRARRRLPSEPRQTSPSARLPTSKAPGSVARGEVALAALSPVALPTLSTLVGAT